MAITRIGNPAIADQRGINFRNIIINGGMDVAQRGTSFTGLTNGNNSDYTVDRFNFSESGSETFVFTVSQSTDVPTGQGFANSLKYLVTTADTSLDSLGGVALNYRMEGQHLQYLKKGTANAESLTLSFWFKSSLTGTYIAELFDRDNDRTISKSYTVNTANTWEKKIITFDGDTTGTFDNDNARSMDLTFWFSAGSGYQSGTLQTTWGSTTTANRVVGQVDWSATVNNELYITGVQLETGQVASDFEFLPYDVNYKRCQRYYQRIQGSTSDEVAIGMGYSDTTGGIRYYHTLSTTMRGIPSASENGLRSLGRSTLQSSINIGVVFDVASENPEVVGLDITADSGTPFTQFDAQLIRLDNLDNAYLEFDAEL